MINGKVSAEFCIPCFYFFMIYYRNGSNKRPSFNSLY